MNTKTHPRAHSTGVSRRTVARTAAWAVPVVTTAIAAPALAASTHPCTGSGPGSLWTDMRTNRVDQISFGASDAGGAVAEVTYAKVSSKGRALDAFDDTDTGTTGRVQYSTGWPYVILGHPEEMHPGDVLTMTITFPAPVANFSLTLTQVGADGNNYVDRAYLAPSGFSVTSKGTGVGGFGAQTAVFYGTSYENIRSTANDVTVVWPGQNSQFKVCYVVDSRATDSSCGEWIGVGSFSYDNCG